MLWAFLQKKWVPFSDRISQTANLVQLNSFYNIFLKKTVYPFITFSIFKQAKKSPVVDFLLKKSKQSSYFITEKA